MSPLALNMPQNSYTWVLIRRNEKGGQIPVYLECVDINAI